MSENKESKQKKEASDPPALEWLTAAIGFVLVAGAIGFLVYQAIVEEATPPSISVSVESIHSTNNGFLVDFRVENEGAMTASALTIEGELKKGSESIETSTATIDYSPSHSKRKGGLIFTKNPQDFEFTIRAIGFENP